MEAWELALALSGSFVAGYVGSVLGLVLGTLRLPLIVAITGSPLAAAGTNIAGALPGGWLGAKATGRLDERVLRLALGVMLVVVGVTFAAQAAF